MSSQVSKTPVKFNLPYAIAEQLRQQVPAGQKSRFVAEALEIALKKHRIAEAISAIDNAPVFGVKDGMGSVESTRSTRNQAEQKSRNRDFG